MRDRLVRKGLVFGIIILFVGASIVPNISADPVSQIAEGNLGLRSPTRKLARALDGVLHCVYHRSDGLHSQIYHSWADYWNIWYLDYV